MADRYNITIAVKKTIDAHAIEDSRGNVVRQGVGNSSPVMQERQVIDRLSFNISAETEAEAYVKAIRILEVNAPETVTLFGDDRVIGEVSLADNNETRPK